MDTFAQTFSLLSIFLQIHLFSAGNAKTLRLTNNCSYTVWPAISSRFNNPFGPAGESGFVLRKGETRLVNGADNWSVQIWGRTLCSTNKSTGNFSCQTGDCNTGNIRCASLPSVNPFTLVEITLGLMNGNFYDDFYDVSVVDGYNLPLSVAPRVDSGPGCEVTGCVLDLQKSCQPAEFRVVSKSNDSLIIGCKMPTKSSSASLIFKRPCPRAAYGYARDEATYTFSCDSSRASSYDITFCPSPAMSRLLSKPASQALQPALAPEPGTTPPMVLSPTPLSPTPLSPTPLSPTPLSPTPLSPTPLSPTPLSPTANSTTKPLDQTLRSNTGKRKVHTGILIAVLTAAGISILGLFGIYYFCISKRKTSKKFNVQTGEMKRLANSLQFDFTTIRLATQNFAAENKLGQGGFGDVYKGTLEGGQEVAVKRLSKNSAQGIAEFEMEIVLVAGLQHKNLVKLLGYCASSNESLLVYEFLPNSSLDKFLFDPAKKSSLDWQTRFNIISGIARGLLYLHEDSRIKVVHRDLKSSNILLDEAMNPKIADFGLARLFEVDQTQGDTKRIVGTYGYMAPEYAITGHYSVKSDVYSFRVIVLEIVSGQRTRSFGRLQLDEALLHRAWRLWNEDEPLNLIDTVLGDNIEQEEVLKCIHLGLLCIQENAIDRPRMTSIVAALSDQAIHLPTPKPPHFFGCAVEDEARDVPSGYAAPYVHTGDETITNVYSRD